MRNHVLPTRAAIVLLVLCVLAGTGALFVGLASGRPIVLAIAVLLCATPLLLHLLLVAPRVYCWALGGVLGLAPFATIPGSGFQMVYVLAVGALLVALLHPDQARAPSALSRILIALLLLSFVSVLATNTGTESFITYAKWALAASVTLMMLRMRGDVRLALSRSFAIGAALGGALAAVLTVVDPDGEFLGSLTIIGYGSPDAVNVRTAVVDGGEVVRAAGLYVDPNTAGLFLCFALGVAGVAFAGVARVLLIAVLAAGAVATLSRAAIISLVVGAVIYLVVRRQSAGARALIAIGGAAALAVLLFIPQVSGRLLDSADSSDVGAAARIDAFGNYPGQMEGRWIFGRGWDLREFTDAYYGYLLNHVANTPLLVVYRGGLLVGIVFLALLVAGIVLAFRALRTRGAGAAITASVYLGLVLIAFQLDFPVVTMQPLTMGFAVLLAALHRAGGLPPEAPPPPFSLERRLVVPRHLTVPRPAEIS